MRILGIDTAIPRASAAIVEDGRLLVEEIQGGSHGSDGHRNGSPGRHSEILLPLIQSVLERAQFTFRDLSGLSVTIGPGSFTGLRIGLATAKGIAYHSNLPLFGISTLEANAARARHFDGLLGSLIDARKGEVYAALFRCTGKKITRLTSDSALPLRSAIELIRQYQMDNGPALVIGSGAKAYEGQLGETLGPSVRITCGVGAPSIAAQAAWLAGVRAERGDADDLGAVAPVYLRVADAERSTNRLSF